MYSSYWSAEEDLQKMVSRTKDLLNKYEEEQFALEDLIRELSALRRRKGLSKTPAPGGFLDLEALGIDPDTIGGSGGGSSSSSGGGVTRDEDDPEQMTLGELVTKRDILISDCDKHESSLSVLRGFIKTTSFQINHLKQIKSEAKSNVKKWLDKFKEENGGKEASPLDKQDTEPARLYEEYAASRKTLESSTQQRKEGKCDQCQCWWCWCQCSVGVTVIGVGVDVITTSIVNNTYTNNTVVTIIITNTHTNTTTTTTYTNTDIHTHTNHYSCSHGRTYTCDAI